RVRQTSITASRLRRTDRRRIVMSRITSSSRNNTWLYAIVGIVAVGALVVFGRSRPAPPPAATETEQSAATVAPPPAAEQFIPLPSFRVGAYASSGIPVWGGFIDYINYLNDVEGGINGVKLVI